MFAAVALPSAAIGALGNGFVNEVQAFFGGNGEGSAAPTRLITPTVRLDPSQAIDFPRQADALRRALDSDPATGATAELVARLGIVGDRSDVPRLLDLGEHPNQAVSMAALQSLGRLGGPRAIRRLTTVAKSEDATHNAAAVAALGLSSDPRAVEVLEDLSRHADAWRRQQALDALAVRGGARARAAIHRAFLKANSGDAWASANAVATLGGPADKRLLIAAATSPHDPRADAALWALATLSGPDTDELLIRMAETATGPRRSTAISVLASVTDPRAVEVLLDLWDRSPVNRYDVINALGASEAPGALDGLLTLLGEGRTDQAVWLASALAARPEETAREVLRVLASEEGPLADAALSSLTTLGDPSAVTRLLARFDEDGRLPPADTLTFLATRGGDEGWQLIEEVLAEGSQSDRANVVWALQARGDEDAATRLLDLVDTSDSWTASSAIGALEGMGEFARDGLRTILLQRLEDGTDFAAVSSTLGRLGGDEVREALVKRLDDGTDGERWSAISALGQMDDPSARAALEAMIDDADPTIRNTALSTLLWSGSQQIPPEMLDKALLDEDVTVRTTAIAALANQPGPEGIDRLLEFVDDDDPSIRVTAISTLGSSGDPRAEDVLISVLDDPDLSQSAMWGLQSLGTDEGRAAIRNLAAHSDDPERRVAALGMLGQDPSSEAGDVLAASLHADDAGEASAALFALQARGNSSAAEAIATLLDEIDPDDDPHGMLWQVASALQGIGGRVAREHADQLEDILGSADQGLMDMGDWGCGGLLGYEGGPLLW
jgi:HEAT repeat protein